jgi:hypothetical protein
MQPTLSAITVALLALSTLSSALPTGTTLPKPDYSVVPVYGDQPPPDDPWEDPYQTPTNKPTLTAGKGSDGATTVTATVEKTITEVREATTIVYGLSTVSHIIIQTGETTALTKTVTQTQEPLQATVTLDPTMVLHVTTETVEKTVPAMTVTEVEKSATVTEGPSTVRTISPKETSLSIVPIWGDGGGPDAVSESPTSLRVSSYSLPITSTTSSTSSSITSPSILNDTISSTSKPATTSISTTATPSAAPSPATMTTSDTTFVTSYLSATPATTTSTKSYDDGQWHTTYPVKNGTYAYHRGRRS